MPFAACSCACRVYVYVYYYYFILPSLAAKKKCSTSLLIVPVCVFTGLVRVGKRCHSWPFFSSSLITLNLVLLQEAKHFVLFIEKLSTTRSSTQRAAKDRITFTRLPSDTNSTARHASLVPILDHGSGHLNQQSTRSSTEVRQQITHARRVTCATALNRHYTSKQNFHQPGRTNHRRTPKTPKARAPEHTASLSV